MAIGTTARAVTGNEVGVYPGGAAFIDGAYVPIDEAKIPILDWGFVRSDCEVLVTRGMAPKHSRDPRECENRFYAFVIPFVWIATEEMRARGIHLHVSDVLRIPPQSVDPSIKSFHWADLTKGLMQAYDQGCDMPVLVDQEGNIAEGPGSNVFAVKEGTVTTPEGTCLLGISRQTALDLLAEQNVEVVIGPISPAELRGADEVFMTSTAGGILPVTRIDHQAVDDGEPGPVTTRLNNLYWERHDQGWQGTPVDYD